MGSQVAGRVRAMGLLAAVAVAACSVTTPLRVALEGQGIDRGRSVSFVYPAPAGPLDGAFRAALTQALGEAGVSVTDSGGDYLVDVAVTTRSSELGVAKSPQAGAVDVDWLSQPRRKRLLDKCPAQRLRVSLTAISKLTGDVAFRSVGEADGCAFSEAEAAALARDIAAKAVAP